MSTAHYYVTKFHSVLEYRQAQTHTVSVYVGLADMIGVTGDARVLCSRYNNITEFMLYGYNDNYQHGNAGDRSTLPRRPVFGAYTRGPAYVLDDIRGAALRDGSETSKKCELNTFLYCFRVYAYTQNVYVTSRSEISKI